MAETQSIVIHDYKADPNTGRIELHLKVRHEEGSAVWDGPVRQYSADPQTLRDRFNGDISQFENWAAREHKSVEGIAPEKVQELLARKGQVIG